MGWSCSHLDYDTEFGIYRIPEDFKAGGPEDAVAAKEGAPGLIELKT